MTSMGRLHQHQLPLAMVQDKLDHQIPLTLVQDKHKHQVPLTMVQDKHQHQISLAMVHDKQQHQMPMTLGHEKNQSQLPMTMVVVHSARVSLKVNDVSSVFKLFNRFVIPFDCVPKTVVSAFSYTSA